MAIEQLEFTDEPLTDTPDVPAPKRRGRPPGSRNNTSSPSGDKAPRRGSRASVRLQAVGLIGALNLGLSMSPYKDDALSEQESDLLADALTAEAMNSERILSWLQKAGAISPHLLMLRAIVTIATPRLMRHGILPMPSEEKVRADLREQGYTDEQINQWFEQSRQENGFDTPVPVATG